MAPDVPGKSSCTTWNPGFLGRVRVVRVVGGRNMMEGYYSDVGEVSFSNILLESGGDLLSRAVTSQVPSAHRGLTSVFGMGTGGTL